MTEKKATIVDGFKVPGIGSQWRRSLDESTVEVKQVEYPAETSADDVEIITTVWGGSYDDDGSLETWRHTLRRFHGYHAPVSQIVEGMVEPRVGSKWRDRETGKIVTVKLVGRSTRFAGQFVSFEREDRSDIGVLPLRNFHTDHEPMPDEESPPVTHAFLTGALQGMQERLEEIIGQSMDQVWVQVNHMLAEKKQAEPGPDDLPREALWAATPRELERIRAQVYEHGYAVGNKEGYQRGAEEASVRTGPHVTPDGAYYTPKEIEAIKEAAVQAALAEKHPYATYTSEDVKRAETNAYARGRAEATHDGKSVYYTDEEIERIEEQARDLGFEAGKIAGHAEYQKDVARGVYYTNEEIDTIREAARRGAIAEATRDGKGVYYTDEEIENIRGEARQTAIASSTKVRAHLILALQDATSALVDLGTLVIQGPNEKNADKRGGVAIGLRRAAHRIQHGSMKGFDDTIDPGLAAAEKRAKELVELAKKARQAIYERTFMNEDQWSALHDLLCEAIDAKPDTGTMSRD